MKLRSKQIYNELEFNGIFTKCDAPNETCVNTTCLHETVPCFVGLLHIKETKKGNSKVQFGQNCLTSEP